MTLTACGGGGSGGYSSPPPPPPATYSIGGTVTGLSASGLTLDDNGGDTLTVSSGASTFTFATKITSGGAYAVTVATQPTGETCTVSSGSGSATANVTSVAVACTATATFTIGGTISGLKDPNLTLDDNGGDTLAVNPGATTFTFATALQSGAAYNVTVASQALGQTCTASSNTGNASANVTSVAISCVNSGVTVGTLAGTGPPGGNTNGAGNVASFLAPAGTAVDSSGNVYVAEYANNDIRKITPAGQVSLFAGSASQTSGKANGTGSAASFWNPTGVAVDSAGNVYVADESNNEIRMITSAGVVTLLAGSAAGTAGNADGTGTAATFSSPAGIAIDSSGNLWVADSVNNEIRKIAMPGAVVTTYAGSTTPGLTNGTGIAAKFKTPFGIAVDSSGNLYIADRGNNEIRKIDTAAGVTLLAGSPTGAAGHANGTGGPAGAATFFLPSGVAVDSAGNVYVADTSNSEIRLIAAGPVVTTYAGSTSAGNTNGSATTAQFDFPYGIAIDAAGNLFIGDNVNDEVREIAP